MVPDTTNGAWITPFATTEAAVRAAEEHGREQLPESGSESDGAEAGTGDKGGSGRRCSHHGGQASRSEREGQEEER